MNIIETLPHIKNRKDPRGEENAQKTNEEIRSYHLVKNNQMKTTKRNEG